MGAHPEKFEIGVSYKLTYNDTSVYGVCVEIRDEWGDGAPNNQGQVDDFAFIPGDHPFSQPVAAFMVESDWDDIYMPPDGKLKAGQVVWTALTEHAEIDDRF